MLERLLGQLVLFLLVFVGFVGMFLWWTMPGMIPMIDKWIGEIITPQITLLRVIVVGLFLAGIALLAKAFETKPSEPGTASMVTAFPPKPRSDS